MNFQVSDKVVCVKDVVPHAIVTYGLPMGPPIKGAIYVVCGTGVHHYKGFPNEPTIMLVGVPCLSNSNPFAPNRDIGWPADGFRKLEEVQLIVKALKSKGQTKPKEQHVE